METDVGCLVASARGSDFPLENLPYGVAELPGLGPRALVAIGDSALDLRAVVRDGLLDADGAAALGSERGALDEFIGLEPAAWAATRAGIRALLEPGSELGRAAADGGADADDLPIAKYLHARRALVHRLPCTIGDYTDFYSSVDHARRVGTMFRGAESALMPNWTWMPIAYHGRASSVVVSGGAQPRRPRGQLPPAQAGGAPAFGPTAQLDYELELGFVIGGRENALGAPVALAAAEARVFGCVLVNDWSARDLQRWEYVPLGPFASKSFLTTISPWVVPLAALEAARCAPPPAAPEAAGRAPLAYLRMDEAQRARAAIDIELEVALSRPEWAAEATVCAGNARALYWSVAQQVAHHTVSGCNLRPGDLLASGTISGPAAESAGCLLERTWRGERPLRMPDGSTRAFLLDGDTVIMRAAAAGPNGARIGFGECVGTVLPAHAD